MTFDSFSRGRRRAAAALRLVVAIGSIALVSTVVSAPSHASTPAHAEMTTAGSAPLPGWLHKDGQYFTYWLPNKDWQAVETNRALDITSPTGLYDVSYGWSELVMPTTTSQIFKTIMEGHAQDMKDWKVLQAGPVTQTSQGERQVVEFTCMHRYPLQGWQKIRGIAIADALTESIGYGMDATVMYAPAKVWAKQLPTLDRLRTNITPMHG